MGAALLPGSNRPVFFDGLATVTIPPGGRVQSDPVQMRVLARQDLAVSLYLPDAVVRPSQHTRAGVTSYLSANGSGDVTGIEAAEPFAETTTSMFWLEGAGCADLCLDPGSSSRSAIRSPMARAPPSTLMIGGRIGWRYGLPSTPTRATADTRPW